MVEKECSNCGNTIKMFPSRAKKSEIFFCSKSCHCSYKNKKDNPCFKRDISGKNNPMFGKNNPNKMKGVTGEKHFNWKGGLHRRKDGYFRINVDGKRYLYHRFIKGLLEKGKKVVHHIDHNPSNNNPDNLMVFNNQMEHVRFESKK